MRPRILLVDDDPDELSVLESVLLPLDVDIVSATSKGAALQRLLEEDFAVILLDVRMPGMDGFDTATLVRQRERSASTPIIFITTFSEQMHAAPGYSLRAVDYILAPIVPEVLRTKVSVFVELFRATAEVRRQAESLRQVREATRLKDELIAAVSHELRTPLNALRSWTWLLRQNALAPDKISKILEGIERSVIAQTRIIDGLFDVSRIVSGNIPLAVAPMELRPVVQEAVDALASAADAAGVRLARSLDGDAVRVCGDEARLQQIVSNLVSNGIKFTPSGGKVDVVLAATATEAIVRVVDTGRGIARGLLPHVFDRFRQADGPSTRPAGGLGVGLAIARQLVVMHGGRIEAYSEGEGRGATFTVTLPLLGPPDTGAGQPGRDESARSGLEGMRILVVEDDTDTRQAMALVLTDAGVAVTSVGTTGEGIARLRGDRFDAILCDIGLPDEDGYSFIRRARALHEAAGIRVPALAVTAFACERDVAQAYEAGFDGHLAKPVDPPDVLRSLLALVGRADQLRSPVSGANEAQAVAPTR